MLFLENRYFFQLMLAAIVASTALFGAASIAFEESSVQEKLNAKMDRTKENLNAVQATLDKEETKAGILCQAVR